MPFVKLLRASVELFRKKVITFVTVRRYDLGIINENLNYIAVKPNASISVLRQKLWHLLDLPDYCDELIILKSHDDVQIALTDLRKGNEPHRPYILEVWLPGKQGDSSTSVPRNILMIQDDRTNVNLATGVYEKVDSPDKFNYNSIGSPTISNETILKKLRSPPTITTDYKKSELSCQISNSSIFRMHGKKSRDNFTNLLLKIQSDLSVLTNKLTILENKIPS